MFVAIRDLRFAKGRFALMGAVVTLITLLVVLLSGLTVSEIALRRHRSVKTVSTQKVAALRKLGLRNDVEIYALREQRNLR